MMALLWLSTRFVAGMIDSGKFSEIELLAAASSSVKFVFIFFAAQ